VHGYYCEGLGLSIFEHANNGILQQHSAPTAYQPSQKHREKVEHLRQCRRNPEKAWVEDVEFSVPKNLASLFYELAIYNASGEELINTWVGWSYDKDALAQLIAADTGSSRIAVIPSLGEHFRRQKTLQTSMTVREINEKVQGLGERHTLLACYGGHDRVAFGRALSGDENVPIPSHSAEEYAHIPMIDVGRLVKTLTPNLQRHKLAYIHWLMSTNTSLTYHVAADDVIATLEVAQAVITRVLNEEG
jgi:hypothetical protein